MAGAEDSCLIQKFSHYIELSDNSRVQLSRLEEEERDYARGREVYSAGQNSQRLFVVKSGWLYSYTDLPDARRQIVKIHHPGDILGFPDIAFESATTSLRAAEDVTLCPFGSDALREIFDKSPQLTALMFTLAVRDQVCMIDTLRAMGRMSALERLGFLLLDLLARIRIANRDVRDTIRLPLTQAEIGDTLGLTNVYVSKTFSLMEAEGYLSRDGDWITILREEALAEMVDFVDRYATMDTNWFPLERPE